MKYWMMLGVLIACPFACRQNTLQKAAADLVLKGGVIVTMDENNPSVTAIAVSGDRILALGSDADIEAHIGEDTEVIDLAGSFAMPGFIEGHGHLTGIGQAKMALWLMGVENWDTVISMVKEAAEKAEPGEWIVGRGWHQDKWDKTPEPNVNGYPIHTALSAVSPNNPVLLGHASGHAVFANAKAMELAGVNASTKEIEGGAIIRTKNGDPIGVFEENAESLVNKAYSEYLSAMTAEEREAVLRKQIQLAVEDCLSKGITSFHDAGSPFSTIDTFKTLADENALGIRLWVMANTSNEELAEKLPQYQLKGYGNQHLTVGGIKKYVDGALGSRGAWLLEPYTDLPGSIGQNVTTLEELEETARIALENDVQLCTHAIGDRGNQEMLNVYEKVLAGQDKRWRIEHAQHLHPEDIPRFASLKVIASMQGVHCPSDSAFVVKRLGEKRAQEGAYVWKPLLEAGVIVTNGTDAPVEDVSALASYHAMLTRKPANGEPFYPEHALSPMEALKCYTWNNAYAAYEEDVKGSLEIGKLADITVLSKNITTIPADEVLNTEVLYTIVGGDIRFKKQ